MARMSEIEWEPCLLSQRPAPDLERRFSRETGRPGKFMRYFEGSEWLSDLIVRASVQLMTCVCIDPDLVDQAGLVVAQDNSCRFCFGVQRSFLRVLGMSEKRITLLEQDLLTGDFSAREKAALKFARQISQSKPLVKVEDAEALLDFDFSREEIIEFIGLIGLHMFLNRMSTFVALPPQPMENFPDQWWVKLSRPLVAFKFRRMRKRGPSMPHPPANTDGPLAALTNALAPLPMAEDFRMMLERLWLESSLTSRTVTLIFAVVSRALGSDRCEREASKMLREDGLTAPEIAQILDHLASPVLTEIEALLIPLARETVWYQPAKIQRRCAKAQGMISHEQFLDFPGGVSLLNSVCRMGLIVDFKQ
ncbi:MAG: carboxymuconolactone decarboxylase family protein [Gammaproteobacteria bacterium]